MDASEDDQLAAAIAASMQDNNDETSEAEVKQTEIDQEEKHEDEKAQEPVVALAAEPDGTTALLVSLG
ncbi:unnamed protein product [Phytophthora lilii]|uniref:Unnamed protein product n=1 Tax=Phytophthora lilii TaxID=2077276 RepID=A0A9W7CRI3_9STRA|nr:unnamed protein product [Phytophthora lilii]